MLVYEERDELYRLGVGRTRDKKYPAHTSASGTTTGVRTLDARTPAGEFKLVAPRAEGVEYALDHRDGVFHIRTNRAGAVNFRWAACPAGDTAPRGWKDFAPYNPAVYLEGISLFRDFAVAVEREAGVPQLRVHDFAANASHRVPFPKPSYTAAPGANPEFDTPTVRETPARAYTPSASSAVPGSAADE